MNRRIGHVDIAKGISIISVALFHSQLKFFIPEIVDTMSLFRMPLFFLLSGVFFSIVLDLDTFTARKFEALLKPYLVTTLLIFCAAVVLGEKGLASEFLGIFYGNGDTLRWVQLWFLPHLFLVYLISYFVFTSTGIHTQGWLVKTPFLLSMIFIGSYLVDVFWYSDQTVMGQSLSVPGLPLGLDIVLISAAFFMLGSFGKTWVVNFKPNVWILLCTIVAFVLISLYSSAHINLNKRIYAEPVLATAGALCGIYFVLCLSFYLNKTTFSKRLFLVFGQASLFILIFHSFVGDKVFVLLLKSGISGFNLYFAIVAFLLSIVLPLAIKEVVVRSRFLSMLYLPRKNLGKADVFRNGKPVDSAREISALKS